MADISLGDDLTVVGNFLEGFLWIAVSLTFGIMAYRTPGPKRWLWQLLAAAFLLFGISDFIETQTGAWWKPWWLLVMKGSCILIFLYAMWRYRKISIAAPN